MKVVMLSELLYTRPVANPIIAVDKDRKFSKSYSLSSKSYQIVFPAASKIVQKSYKRINPDERTPKLLRMYKENKD